MSVTQIETPPVWGNYVDLNSDVKPYLQIPVASVASDVELQLIIDGTCYWVQNYLGRPIAPTEFFRRFSGYWGTGNGGAYVSLPYYPVTQMVSVIEYWGTSGPHTLTEQTPTNQGGQDVYSMDYLRGYVIRAFDGLVARPFFPGLRNIEVTWWAGYNPIPPDIKLATLKLIKHYWTSEQQASRTAPVPAGTSGYREELPVDGMFVGIPPDIERTFAQYIQQGMG